jgi:riboflavin kinase / FMN adenylyltransferase
MENTSLDKVFLNGMVVAEQPMNRMCQKIRGVVEKGEGAALRDYDVPTANIEIKGRLLIETGVYAAITEHKGKKYESIVCYGTGEDQRKFEVHLFDFDQYIYGDTLDVELLEKVSELIPWHSKERMRQKIVHDLHMVEAVFDRIKARV